MNYGDELTKFELLVLEQRIVEIDRLLDLDIDGDMCDNLIDELEEIELKLQKSMRLAKIRELGLKLA